MKELKKIQEYKGVKLTETTTQVIIDASPHKAWEALSQYGNVSSFHAGIDLSVHGKNNSDEASLGVERTCTIKDGKREIILVERIIEYEEGQFYRYEVFEWKNFPLKVMFFAFAIKSDKDKNTILSITQNYRLKPGFITGIMKGKIKKQQREILMGYKNYIETGEKRVPIATLEKLNYQFS